MVSLERHVLPVLQLTNHQAPEAANQKRKRGGTADASRDNRGASQTHSPLTNTGTIGQPLDNNNEVELDEATRPRKRGRPAKANAIPQPEQELPVDAPKKKRGRRSLQKHQDPVVVGDEQNSAVEEEAQPKKRGRPSLSRQKEPEEDSIDASVIEEPPRPKKRGRPSIAQQNANKSTVNSADETVEPAQPRRRGRPPKEAQVTKETDAVAEEADDENESNVTLLRRGSADHRSPDAPNKKSPRSRKRKPGPKPAAEEDLEDNQDENSSSLRRSNRNRQSVGAWYNGSQVSEEHEEGEAPRIRPKGKGQEQPAIDGRPTGGVDETQPKPRKRGRPSLTRTHLADTSGNAIAKQSKRSAASLAGKGTLPLGQKQQQRGHKQAVAEQEQETAAEEGPRRRGRPRSSDVSFTDPKNARHSSQTQPQSRSSSPDQVSAQAPYRHLTTRTRRVPRETIANKWSPLDAPSVSSVADILHSASRPVLLRLNNLQKHAQATAALNTVSNRLRSKLARGLPFPPASVAHRREDELEFERTVDGIQTLEAQLDPLLHGVTLLQREKERAEKELERDYKILNSLSANARSGVRERREQLRKMHALVPEPSQDEDKSFKAEGELKPAEQASGKIFVGLDNEELKGIAGQIGNHMESLRGNLQQIDGIVPAIAAGRAALRTALLPHFNQTLFEQVLLG
jgi:hypothetical protein